MTETESMGLMNTRTTMLTRKRNSEATCVVAMLSENCEANMHWVEFDVKLYSMHCT